MVQATPVEPAFGLEAETSGYCLRFAAGDDPHYVAAMLRALAIE